MNRGLSSGYGSSTRDKIRPLTGLMEWKEAVLSPAGGGGHCSEGDITLFSFSPQERSGLLEAIAKQTVFRPDEISSTRGAPRNSFSVSDLRGWGRAASQVGGGVYRGRCQW